MKTLLTAAAIAAFAVSAAHAGPAADMAQARIASIAEGDTATVAAAYQAGAVLHWVGGPLDGTYEEAEIEAVWKKFAKAQPNLTADIMDVSEAMNPKGATVTANVVFQGKDKIPVRYIMLFRDGKLTDEIWQVAPALAK
ncbi:MAG: nuclear transport factor 2 family protein [Aurantimonas endophytica]|uniref:SnoaL-like domain-containing protein n=1 Tax=Aurantimonas endophytica TaxID=1522175 RepID=A0A7W6HHH4_9HYPH|nr:nuclear transport factor 2 family protein [Aurantimonas endophytica]MBB4005365.1 hypothetical protein [Aurantimonas endophytica]MCO6405974.1 nuclear transport factor 2 family protein [Aurantimonas endophytica]